MPAGSNLAQRWRNLAHRRNAYYLELFRSGRWSRYFTEQDFIARLREVVAVTQAWDARAARELEQAAKTFDRSRSAA